MVQAKTNPKSTSAQLTKAVDTQIANLVEQVRDTQTEMEELMERMKNVREELRVLLELRGSNWSDESGYARLVTGGIRTSYDREALDQLIIKNPVQYGWLKDYRRESVVQGTVQVK
jgi:hypothetical protein